MNAGARAAHGEVLVFLHADTILPVEADVAIARVIGDGAHWGRFDVSIAGPDPLLAVVAAMMNASLATHRHRHRRPGHLRSPRRFSSPQAPSARFP
jgi:predicted nucleic acid-binding protein